MYHANPRVRDAQNPYRTGVLIGNCWEDKFGRELATQPVSAKCAQEFQIRNYPATSQIVNDSFCVETRDYWG